MIDFTFRGSWKLGRSIHKLFQQRGFQAPPMELCRYRPSWWEPFLDPIWDYFHCGLVYWWHVVMLWRDGKCMKDLQIVQLFVHLLHPSHPPQWKPSILMLNNVLTNIRQLGNWLQCNLHDSQFIFPPSAIPSWLPFSIRPHALEKKTSTTLLFSVEVRLRLMGLEWLLFPSSPNLLGFETHNEYEIISISKMKPLSSRFSELI